ncbi:ROK family protein [candidate division WOR-3 bacterium]|nr:ROK family protein [candidate division WOR-3 bacterium]
MKANFPVLGIDVGAQNIKAGWVKRGDVSDFRKVPFKAENVIQELLNVISCYNLTPLTVIGVGFPGFIRDGRVYNPPNLPTIDEIDLRKLLKGETGSPVYVQNDANACILGEALYGEAKMCRVVAGFTLGTGVGGGLVIDKEVYTGSRGFASEFGHMIIDPSGPVCNCGKRGCLEAFIGAYALSRRYESLTGKNITVKEIFKRAKIGELDAREVVNEFGYYLGVGIRNIVEVYDPGIVILAGGMSKSGKEIIQAIESNWPYETRYIGKVKIGISKLGNKAGPIGVANWALRMHLI